MNKQKRARIFFLFTAALILVAGEIFSQPMDAVLATIGNKQITVYNFLQRSEMTVRPNPFKDKSTTLNNLITEKILALEVEHNSPLLSNPVFQGRIKGLKEQAMREELYYTVAFNKTKIDTAELINKFKLSIRDYEVEFYRMHKNLTDKVKKALESSGGSTDEIFKHLTDYAGMQPVRTVTYKDNDNDDVHEALYSKPLNVGDVIGPLQMDQDDYLIMRVKNWTAHPLLSTVDQQTRWEEIKKKEHRIYAQKKWENYQRSVMRGKRMDFEGKTFNALAKWVRTRYITEHSKIDSAGFQMPEIPTHPKEIDLSAPFFKFDGRVWTVDDFRKELMSHPLVFRTKHIDSSNFSRQFKLAVVDVMRDHSLTREAYKKKMDKKERVGKVVGMWKDAFIAHDAQKNIVDKAFKEGKIHRGDQLGINNFWESYVSELQKKYAGSISINKKLFENISLTTVDMFVAKYGVPYPAVVPAFPLFIESKNLEYATRK